MDTAGALAINDTATELLPSGNTEKAHVGENGYWGNATCNPRCQNAPAHGLDFIEIHRLNQSIAGTVTANASVENKSIDALSASDDLYRAAKRTTTVASGKLQQTSVSRANGLTTCRR